MLRALEIRDMLIIDRLDLVFQPGLNVLTGETGAGKSILLDSLGFVLGWRGRAELVRHGAGQGEVTAVFDLPKNHGARAVLAAAGLPESDDELILRRVNTVDGRKTAWVNDRRCSGEILRALSDTLVELHGQHDDRGLLNPRGHRAMLDIFAGVEAARARTRNSWDAMGAARNKVDQTRAALDAVRAEEERLRHESAELEELDPQLGEEPELDARRRQMQSAEKIRADIMRAHVLLGGEGGDGADSAIGDALRWLEGVAGSAEGVLDSPIAALGRTLDEISDAQRGVEEALEALQYDPFELERIEERLFAIRALARKHDVVPDDLVELTQSLRDRLAALDAGDADLAVLYAELERAEAAYDSEAAKLSQQRAAAAARLDAAVMAELAPLRMERAVFCTEITPADPGPEGRDAVAFTVATNPGVPAGPLNKIASGGELSRFLLALKVCLTGPSSGVTMIFDEIDRGVGGATADAVGRRLAELAEGGQVLVVTHSPQVAARGGHHWRVHKQSDAKSTLSTVTALAETDRIDEIARMLAGDTITTEARAAARALLVD
ncbi:DNA repair protein RecN [Pontibaca salina]|uniref:DNA repair protein RecN n=1 Tax=Pontibaca salina TaxID=2795731 RepID=A0A934M1Q3_9RHOB|nr:DNA repair protein RecN [Pontibaca salina]MBI6629876.1 DNA repair protein RecN [Pontibaca salina]